MPFKLGEHVKATRLGWYGQVVEVVGAGYRVRVGGLTVVRTVAEADLEPIIPDRRVAPRVFPPVDFVKSGGSKTLPLLAYPFTNEPGLKKDTFWALLRERGIVPGAFVGVSGSILDCAQRQSIECQQIISVDFNTETVKAVDSLRTVIALINEINSITFTRCHWLTGVILEKRLVPKGKFLQEIFAAYFGETAKAILDCYTFIPEANGAKLATALRQLETNCVGSLSRNTS